MARIRVDPRSTGISRLEGSDGGRQRRFSEAEDVPVRRLDETVPVSGKRILAKIDVEGFTQPVLEGMSGLIGDNHFVLQVESDPESDSGVDALLKAQGFRQIGQIEADRYFTNFADGGA
jgi:hypothetical protein